MTAATPVQTSASPGPMLEYTGTLVKSAEARSRPSDLQGHVVPVIRCELELNNPQRIHLVAEQRFPVGAFDQAQAAARRLKKGTQITIQAAVTDIRLFAGNTAHIHVVPT